MQELIEQRVNELIDALAARDEERYYEAANNLSTKNKYAILRVLLRQIADLSKDVDVEALPQVDVIGNSTFRQVVKDAQTKDPDILLHLIGPPDKNKTAILVATAASLRILKERK